MWFGDLVDVRTIPEAGQDLHIRWDPTEIEKPDGKFDGMKRVAMITIVVSLSLMVLITFCCIYWRKRKFRDKYDEGGQEDLDLPLFRFDTIAHATNDFSGDNLLGKGGFGPVYKGTLPDQEIALWYITIGDNKWKEKQRNPISKTWCHSYWTCMEVVEGGCSIGIS
ncbi:hypothetical protein L6164_017839 [Bauhinia variegata]|uniref:Uncharacterized protein n=1 Tax=Bauhinia variegata TaxID=167791 RepID=A0ACB9NAI7_BAUVA|nr:hypothetical protein L6164_017839 [Bauhinia variegata]